LLHYMLGCFALASLHLMCLTLFQAIHDCLALLVMLGDAFPSS
jgi:hypothetical protein